MTATKVDGHAVVADEPAVSPLRNRRDNGTIHFSRIRRLLLDDESVVHGCAECDYVGAGVGNVRAHLRVHRIRDAEPALMPTTRSIEDMNVGDLLGAARRSDALADALERMTEDRNHWKARALRAERAMATLRKALNFGGES